MTDQTNDNSTSPTSTALNFRPPSTISPTPSTFKSPSIQFLQGPWHVTHSTLPMWRKNKNVVITYTPITDSTNPGSDKDENNENLNPAIDDLVTYTPLNNPTKTKTVHGTDKPHPDSSHPGTYTWRGHGLLKIASSKWEVIGWGEDDGGWCVTYFAKTLFTPAGIDIYFRRKGTNGELLDKIKQAMLGVEDGEFAKLAGEIFEIVHDG